MYKSMSCSKSSCSICYSWKVTCFDKVSCIQWNLSYSQHVYKVNCLHLKSPALFSNYVICCRSWFVGVLRQPVDTALRGTSFFRSKVYKCCLNCGPEVFLGRLWKHSDCKSSSWDGSYRFRPMTSSPHVDSSSDQVLKIYLSLSACSHGGGEPQVGEVPHLPVVRESEPSHAIFITPGRCWG